MNIDLEKMAANVLTQQIAAEVLKSMTPEHRDALLTKSIKEIVDSYSFRKDVEEAVCDAAAKHATELLADPRYADAIRSYVEEAIAASTKHIAESMVEGMLQLFGGKDGDQRYDSKPGVLYGILAKKMKGEA